MDEGYEMSSDTLSRPSVDTRPARPNGDIFDRVTRFIREVGFPIAVATALIAYLWFVGSKTNEHLAKGAEIMNRAINVLERLERKVSP